MKTPVFALILLGIATRSAQPQLAPAFEVASMKPPPPRAGNGGLHRMDTDPATVRYSVLALGF
jgi:hypothetical protein